MSAVAKNSLIFNHIFNRYLQIRQIKRQTVVQVGSFVLLARSSACVAHAASNMDTDKHRQNAELVQLKSKFGWIKNQVPCFSTNGDNIQVITEPRDFYETFKGMTLGAKRRIVIASLYLGTGQHEKDLVRSIEEACEKAKDTEDFEVHILLDYTRGSRGGLTSSRTMLTPLLQKYGDKVHVYLYHTPDLRGLLKQYIPERFNETVGLSHMKIYLVDDDVIISGSTSFTDTEKSRQSHSAFIKGGDAAVLITSSESSHFLPTRLKKNILDQTRANLSESYFTNRQDRYIQLRNCTEMTDYLTNIVKCMADFTFHLQSDNSTSYPQHSPHPYEGSDTSSVFKTFAGDQVKKVKNSVIEQQTSGRTLDKESDHDTWLCPLIQMGPFGIHDDESVTKQLFERTVSCDKIFLASGYFNLTTQYMKTIIDDSKGQFEILTASPQANGFFGASGISGYVPTAYTDIAQQFYSQVCSGCQDQRISMYEYYRPQWTFHAKGLWYYLPNSSHPVMTFIGSPNFGYRSVYRDLECQLVVMTTNKDLQKQLKQEHSRLYESSTKVTQETFQQPDRYIPLWVKFVTKFMRNFF